MFDAAPHTPETEPLAQSDAFARALRAMGTPPLVLADGTLVLQRRFGPLTAHMLARSDPTPARLAEIRRLPGLRAVILSPSAPLQRKGLPVVPLISPCHLATLDLTADRDTLRRRMHQKWRNRLKHAERQDLRVTRQNMPEREDHWLLQADRAQQAVRGYRSWPPELTVAFARENRGSAKLFCAHMGRSPVAALLVLRHGTDATYHIAHTHPAGRITSAQSLLIWTAMCWLKSKGVRSLELGHIDTEEGAGLARFKLGTGARLQRLGGTWLWWPPVTRLAAPLARLDRRLMSGA